MLLNRSAEWPRWSARTSNMLNFQLSIQRVRRSRSAASSELSLCCGPRQHLYAQPLVVVEHHRERGGFEVCARMRLKRLLPSSKMGLKAAVVVASTVEDGSDVNVKPVVKVCPATEVSLEPSDQTVLGAARRGPQKLDVRTHHIVQPLSCLGSLRCFFVWNFTLGDGLLLRCYLGCPFPLQPRSLLRTLTVSRVLIVARPWARSKTTRPDKTETGNGSLQHWFFYDDPAGSAGSPGSDRNGRFGTARDGSARLARIGPVQVGTARLGTVRSRSEHLGRLGVG